MLLYNTFICNIFAAQIGMLDIKVKIGLLQWDIHILHDKDLSVTNVSNSLSESLLVTE